MLLLTKSQNSSVRMVVHLPPSAVVAGLMQAQRRKLKMADWLSDVVVQACDDAASATAGQQLGDTLAADLFIHVASHDSDLLTGRWRLLYERCRLEPSLWTETLVAGKGGEEAPPEVLRTLNAEAVRERWPSLVASIWLAG